MLVSGLSGFVGQNFKQYILPQSDLQIVEMTRKNLNVGPKDISCLINESGVTAIVHLAGKAHDLKNASSPDEYYKVNFDLTCKLYDAFLESDAEKFIFISSVKAAADSLKAPLTEAHEPDPKTHYGISKLKAEHYITSKALPYNKSYYILRPCMIHGPGNKGNLNLLYKFVSAGIPYPLAAYQNQRSFLSVTNLCFVIENLILADGIPSGIYNVADDDALSTNELVRLIAHTSNHEARLWEVSPSLIGAFAKLGDVLKLPINSDKVNRLTGNYIVENGKLKKALGKELPVSARQGILDTLRSFSKVL